MDAVHRSSRALVLGAILGAAGAVAGALLWRAAPGCFHKRTRVPITILSGFLGAGKTTLLSRLLKNANGLRIAVLVNDLAEVNVDARMVLLADSSSLAAFSQLENGCLCCSTEADVVGAVTKLLEVGGHIDHVVIECSGMAQPSSLMELFAEAEVEGKGSAVLNQMVTLVDGRTLLKWLDGANGSMYGDEAGSLAELLVEQIECANLIILSKVDCLQQAQLRKCCSAIKALNSNAVLECASFGDVSPTVIFGSRKGGALLLNTKKSSHAHHHHDHEENQLAPHVRSFVYKSRRPFQPQRLVITLRNLRTQKQGDTKWLGRGVLRAKGLVWLATDMKRAREWAQVGETLHLHNGDLWKEEWTAVENEKEESCGDRRQEIVFIGTGEMQEADIRNALDSCLLTSQEMECEPHGWQKFPDPCVITPTVPRHKRPSTHGVGCTCCDPDLKLIDQAVSRQIG